ncbi:response regulator, partial [Streptomyces sp. A7024]
STGTDTLEGLIKSVLAEFDTRPLARVLHGIEERRPLLMAAWIPARLAVRLATAYFGLPGLVDLLWRTVGSDPRARNDMRETLVKAVDEWRAEQPRLQRTLVVFIDDLDRCPGETVLAVCEALKVYLDIPGLAFVIGCDRAELRLRDGDGPLHGTGFLEKIFQTSFRLPHADPDRVREYARGCAGDAGIAHLLDDELTELLVRRAGRNPRRIKLLVNGFVLEITLNPVWRLQPAAVVFRLLLLQYFYADFYRLLTRPREADDDDGVVAEFDAYRRARQLLPRMPNDWSGELITEAARILEPYEIELDRADTGRTLERLEQQLPVGFRELVADQGFVSLLDDLKAVDDADELFRMLRSEPAVRGEVEAESIASAHASAFDASVSVAVSAGEWDGMRILWVDDHPENNTRELDRLRAAGASVATASTSSEAGAYLGAGGLHLLISDVQRGSSRMAGPDDLAMWREEGSYKGPAVFYTMRVSPALKERARELGALVASTPSELFRAIGLIDDVVRTAPESRPSAARRA